LHEARHTYVSFMHTAGCWLEELGDFFGHSSTYMVDRYRHLLDGQCDRAAESAHRRATGAPFGSLVGSSASMTRWSRPWFDGRRDAVVGLVTSQTVATYFRPE